MRDTSLFVQKVSVMMPWQYFARYNITTCRMRQRILFRPETCLEMGLANDAANLAMGPGNDAARLRTASVSQDHRKCLRTASVRQDHRQDSVLVLPTHPVGSV